MVLVVKYVTSGIPKVFERIAQREHMRVYNIFADASEELYKNWNEEYDETFEKMKDGSFDITHYNSWIAQRMITWINDHTHSSIMTFSVDPRNMNIVGHLKHFVGSKIYFYLVQK